MHDDGRSGRRTRQLNHLLETSRDGQPFDHRRLRIATLPRSRSAMAFFELGDPRGIPLLCLHGLSVSGYFFNQFHARFARPWHPGHRALPARRDLDL